MSCQEMTDNSVLQLQTRTLTNLSTFVDMLQVCSMSRQNGMSTRMSSIVMRANPVFGIMLGGIKILTWLQTHTPVCGFYLLAFLAFTNTH